MPAFGNAYSDVEIAAVANYVTARSEPRDHNSPQMTWRVEEADLGVASIAGVVARMREGRQLCLSACK